MDMDTAVRFLDDVKDGNPKTNDLCPGKIDGKKLVKIGIQTERRISKLWKKSVKHIIFVLDGTREIWYKNTVCYPTAVKMGFSASKLKMHPKAVPMEVYAQAFLEPTAYIPRLDAIGSVWLARNDYALQK